MPWLRLSQWTVLVNTLVVIAGAVLGTMCVCTLMAGRVMLQVHDGNFAVGWGGRIVPGDSVKWFAYVLEKPRLNWGAAGHIGSDYRGGTTAYIPGWIPVSVCVLSSAAVWVGPVARRRWVAKRRLGKCAACGYDTRGIGEAKCPECGRAITPMSRTTSVA